MRNLAIQGLVIVVLFLSTLFVLQRVDWMTLFKVQQTTEKTEEKLGDLFWDFFKKTDREIKNPLVMKAIDSLVNKICISNDIDREKIKVHILENEQINAFALPNGHLVIYTGLILETENQEELSGVICHEIAHIELNHVMKKLIKEIGISALISMTTGGSGSEIIRETATILSSSAFDRNLEKEADIKAVEYLQNAKISAEPFAEFLYKLSEEEADGMQYLSWISSHPASKERAEYVMESGNNKNIKTTSIISQSTWNKINDILSE